MSLTVFFNLDATIFNHEHSLQKGLASIQKIWENLAKQDLDTLATQHDIALNESWAEYLGGKITREECHYQEVTQFLTSFDTFQPTAAEVRLFLKVYQKQYQSHMKATRGSAETLMRLHHAGARIAIITNGNREEQILKINGLGIARFIDRVITPEEAGCCKPDRRIFEYAMEQMGSTTFNSLMVGYDVEKDIQGAKKAGMLCTLYSPEGDKKDVPPNVATINNMRDLLYGPTGKWLHLQLGIPYAVGPDGTTSSGTENVPFQRMEEELWRTTGTIDPRLIFGPPPETGGTD